MRMPELIAQINPVTWPAVSRTCSSCGLTGYAPRLDNKSRMSREVPVRFRESLGVQFRAIER